jgi:GNAT superfamily N-acetyltransferase
MKTAQSTRLRHYEHPADYERVGEFLAAHYQPGNVDGNWLQPTWEYAQFHPLLDSSSLGKIGIWEADGKSVAVAHYEWNLGDAFFEFHPNYRHLRAAMLDYAQANMMGKSQRDGRKYLCAFVNDNDTEFQRLVELRGYERYPNGKRPQYCFDIPERFPTISLPAGFRLTSLAEECDWAKVHKVLWRGFDHGDDVPMNEEEYESRRKMFDTPTASRDLKIAVAAPNGDFAAFCGMFYEPHGRFAMVEPVATDPIYRRMGLGKAAVLEGIRRCSLLGATVAYVGSDQQFYKAIGFTKGYITECWLKYFD